MVNLTPEVRRAMSRQLAADQVTKAKKRLAQHEKERHAAIGSSVMPKHEFMKKDRPNNGHTYTQPLKRRK